MGKGGVYGSGLGKGGGKRILPGGTRIEMALPGH